MSNSTYRLSAPMLMALTSAALSTILIIAAALASNSSPAFRLLVAAIGIASLALAIGILRLHRKLEQRETNHLKHQSESQQQLLSAEAKLAEQREQVAHVTRLSTLGEMAASLAHEINQPLTAITTYSQACIRMLKNDNVAVEDLVSTLEKSATQAQRAGEVVRRLRTFVNKRSSERLPTDTHALLLDIIKLAEVDARIHGQQLKLKLPGNKSGIKTGKAPTSPLENTLPEVLVDEVQIQQVLLNLIRNALQATREAERDYPVTIEAETDQRGWVTITVIDRGTGLTDEQQQQLFSLFFTTKAEGMGIGLSVSTSIVEAHGSQLVYRPNPEGGAIFSFALPGVTSEDG